MAKRKVEKKDMNHFSEWLNESFKTERFGEVLTSELKSDKYFPVKYLVGYTSDGFAVPTGTWQAHSPYRGFLSMNKITEVLKERQEKDEKKNQLRQENELKREEKKKLQAIREEERKAKLHERWEAEDKVKAEKAAEKEKKKLEKEEVAAKKKADKKIVQKALKNVKLEQNNEA